MFQCGGSLGEGLRFLPFFPAHLARESVAGRRKGKKILIIPGPDLITAIMARDSQHMIVITVAKGNP